jgi:hypothetical protein
MCSSKLFKFYLVKGFHKFVLLSYSRPNTLSGTIFEKYRPMISVLMWYRITHLHESTRQSFTRRIKHLEGPALSWQDSSRLECG